MSGAAILRAARAAGLDLRVDGDGLVLQAHAPPPPPEILDGLVRHKLEILDLLRHGREGWSAEDWQPYLEECAAIAEFDGGLPRPEAEARAFARRVVEWLNRNFERSPPDRCLSCGGGEHVNAALLPCATELTGHVWLNLRRCIARHAGQQADSVAALESMSVKFAGEFPEDFAKRGTG